MRLRDYLVAVSEKHEPVGLRNRALKRVAARAGISPHTLYAISIGRRHAAPETAKKISTACDGHVEPREMIKHEKQKPGPKIGSRRNRARDQ